MEIGIEVEDLLADTRPTNKGRKASEGHFRFRCRPLGLEHESPYLASGLDEIRRLRVKELERRVAADPHNRELRAMLREARAEDRDDADQIIEMLGIEGAKYKDEIPAAPEEPLTVRDKRAAAKEWREALAARKKESGRKKENAAA